jgi:hypothetical protein
MNIASSKKAPSHRDQHQSVQPIASAGYSDYRKPVMNERNEDFGRPRKVELIDRVALDRLTSNDHRASRETSPVHSRASSMANLSVEQQGRFFALSTNNQSNTSLNQPKPSTLPRTVSRDSDVERSLRGLTDDEQSIKSNSLRGRNKSQGKKLF